MKLARAAVYRPVFALMMAMIVVLLGAMALSRLQVDLLPSIELPTLSIRSAYAGADPEVMERLVTQIVEEIIATVPGVEEMSSQSYEGGSRVRVSFSWGTDIDTVAVDVQATIADEISELPDDIVGPRVSKFDVDSFPVVVLGIASRLDPVELTELVENQIRYRFARIPGVAQVDPWGGYTRELRVELDPTKLNALGLPINSLLTTLKDANLDLPAGKIESGQYEVSLRAPAEFASLDDVRNTVIAKRDGSQVRLSQVAIVKDSYEKLTRAVRINGEPGLRVAIRKQAGANTVEVAQRVLAEIEAVNAAFPQIRLTSVIDQGDFIQRSIDNVARSVLYGGALAVFVLLYFLRSVRSTLVIALAIPVSILATFVLLYFGGFTINLMTLGGLALGVGMMVDSSVVVLENIYRRFQERGEDRFAAAVNGTNEVASAVIAGTVTTLTIFLPLIFLRDVSGVLFKELAYVIMFSLLCSLLVALALVPMFAARLLRQRAPAGALASRMAAQAAAQLNALERHYQLWLRAALARRGWVVAICLILLLLSALLARSIGTEFLPPSDEGEVRVSGEMEVGTRLDLLDRQSQLMEQLVVANVPEMRASVVTANASGDRGRAKAQTEMRISLTPAAQRSRSNVEVAAALREQLSGKVAGLSVRTRAPQGQFLLERIVSNAEGLSVEVRGYDLAVLAALAQEAAQRMRAVAGVSDVDLRLDEGIPQQRIYVQRDKIADLGLSVRDVIEVVETAVAGSKAGEYRVAGNAYAILVQLADAQRRSIDEILDLSVRTPSGDQVALRNLVRTEQGRGPVIIERKDQQRLVLIQANVAGRDLGSVAAEMQRGLDSIAVPAGYELKIAGNFAEQQKAFAELASSLLLAVALVYMVLASQYESLRLPLVVMVSVPVASIGVVAALLLSATTLNLQSAIGCIMLCGIVVNNAILLVDQSARLQRAGYSCHDALIEAGRLRLRPILMTTLTTILALLPLALGIGEGADAQAPMARVVLGGLSASTVISLLLVPVLYSLLHGARASAR